MKFINHIQNIIIWISLAFILTASSFFMITFMELPLDGSIIGLILSIPIYVLYDRLKIKEKQE